MNSFECGHRKCKMLKNVNAVYSGCALSYPASLQAPQAHHSNNLKQIIEVKNNRLKIPTGRRQISWVFTKRGGVEFGTTENKSSYWQRGELEPGTSGLQVQRPNH